MTTRTNSKAGYPLPGLDAAREGRHVQRYVNALTGINTARVLTEDTFLYPIPDGQRLVIVSFYMRVNTVDDWVTVQMCATENANGTGARKTIGPPFRVDTGAAFVGNAPSVVPLIPPHVITHDDGQAFSAYVQGNDANASLTLHVEGWYEEDTASN